MSDKQIISATICEHRLSGMRAILDGGGEAWIPHDEFSYEPDFDSEDILALRAQWPVGCAVQVIPLGQAASHRHTTVVSVASAKHDPWDRLVPNWLLSNEIKAMVVADVGQTDCLYGEIARGVRACLLRDDYLAALGQQGAADAFFLPLPGDRIAGRVVARDPEKRLVYLAHPSFFAAHVFSAARRLSLTQHITFTSRPAKR